MSDIGKLHGRAVRLSKRLFTEGANVEVVQTGDGPILCIDHVAIRHYEGRWWVGTTTHPLPVVGVQMVLLNMTPQPTENDALNEAFRIAAMTRIDLYMTEGM